MDKQKYIEICFAFWLIIHLQNSKFSNQIIYFTSINGLRNFTYF